MVNRSRASSGRYSRKVNNSNTPVAPPSSLAKDGEYPNSPVPTKKRKLNNGASQSAHASRPTSTEPEHWTERARSAPTSGKRLPGGEDFDETTLPLRSTQSSKLEHTDAGNGTTSSKKEDKRTLRSQDVGRPRSELANFFADFEDVVYGDGRKKDRLRSGTKLRIIDTPSKYAQQRIASRTLNPETPTVYGKDVPLPKAPVLANNAVTRERLPQASSAAPPAPTFRRISLPATTPSATQRDSDPLADELYDAAHRRGERREKQSRNWDKERAMHEKGELERLLEDLQGPEWLRLMGLTGLGELEAKHYKPKRNIFIARAKSMLERYDAWKERDRDLKLARERRLARLEDMTDSEDAGSSGSSVEEEEFTPRPRYHRGGPQEQKLSFVEPPQPKPIESFFEKPHMREAALKGYRRGRHVLAFGHPIPEMPEEADFELPQSIVGNR